MRAIIIDDEPLLRLHLDKLLADIWPELEVIAKVGDGEAAIQQCQNLKPDIIFLDIRMPGLDGLEVAKLLNQNPEAPAIVFITAYDEYAIQAFEQQAVDYLLKPVELSRLEASCQRLKARIQHKQPVEINIAKLLQQMQSKTQNYLKWIKASKGEEIHLIDTEQCSAFIAEDKYTTICTEQGQYIIRTSLKELKAQLDPEQFWQVHRSSIVQVKAIAQIKKDLIGRLQLTLNTGKNLKVSRKASALFKSM